MVSIILIRPVTKRLRLSRFLSYGSKFYSTKISKPLRILFCGSDEFSIASLRAIHAEHKRDPELIKSINVLCRPGKPAGRSLKQIREAPIKAVAQDLRLALHERDTFTGWDLPKPDDESINLIVAVSFGLFVPPRILKSVEYGGLNVHPSLLPNYRGPAPLQRMLIRGVKDSGVTLQTLDDKSFDHGIILAQDHFTLEGGPMTYQKLLEIVLPKAAKILVSGLQNRLFVPPLIEDTKWQHKLPKKLVHAPKITSADRKVYWHDKSAAEQIPLRQLAVGRLWTSVLVDSKTTKRLIIEDTEMVDRPATFKRDDQDETTKKYHKRILQELDKSIHFIVEDPEVRQPLLYVEDGTAVIFRTPTKGIRVQRMTLEGQQTKDASKVMQSLRGGDAWRLKWTQRPGRIGNHGKFKLVALPRDVDEKIGDATSTTDSKSLNGAKEVTVEVVSSSENLKVGNGEMGDVKDIADSKSLDGTKKDSVEGISSAAVLTGESNEKA